MKADDSCSQSQGKELSLQWVLLPSIIGKFKHNKDFGYCKQNPENLIEIKTEF
jgi:hypothetical protein